ncbi:MAG: T9SS type A sorting domain-containing protein [Rhodothermaceae bacterium]|nr:T9SS type A sorting domain-containing protein [Rhodothermaceae bacterium]
MRIPLLLLFASALWLPLSVQGQSFQASHPNDETGATSAVGGSVVLYDQTANIGANGAPSQEFPDFAGQARSADDFVVPTGESWMITDVFVLGSYNDGGTTDGGAPSWNVAIYEDDGGLPGTEVFSEAAITNVTDTAGDVTIALTTPPTLTEGTYFVSVVAVMSFAPNNAQWFWSAQAVQTNSPYAFEDTDGLFGIAACATWQPGAATCGVGGGVEPDLSFSISGAINTANEAGSELPRTVSLGESYPNPFTAGSTVPFTVDETSHVRLAVYDVLGREVALLADGSYPVGTHRATLDARPLPSGTYVYRLEANGEVQMRTMTLVK